MLNNSLEYMVDDNEFNLANSHDELRCVRIKSGELSGTVKAPISSQALKSKGLSEGSETRRMTLKNNFFHERPTSCNLDDEIVRTVENSNLQNKEIKSSLDNIMPMKGMWLAAEKDKLSLRSLKESDLVVTTGFKLKQTFSNFNNNVHVFRNMFDWNMPMWKLERDKKYDGKIVIGWVGLTSHFEDLKKMKPILKAIHDKYPNTVFILAGMALKDTNVMINDNPDGTKDIKEEEVTDVKLTYRFRVKDLYGDFDKDRIEFFDAVPLEEYGKFYKDLDLSICYVERNTFSQCKSEIKAVESMKYAASTLYSFWGGYKDMFQMLPSDLKNESKLYAIDTENPNTWIENLCSVIDNLEYHKNVANKLKLWVEDKYDINKNVHERVDFINSKVEEYVERSTHEMAKYSVLID